VAQLGDAEGGAGGPRLEIARHMHVGMQVGMKGGYECRNRPGKDRKMRERAPQTTLYLRVRGKS